MSEACGVTNGVSGLRAKVKGLLQGIEAEINLVLDVMLPAACDPIPYALETDWPVGAAGFEPLHLEIESAELHPAWGGLGVDRARLNSRMRKFESRPGAESLANFDSRRCR